MNNRDFLRAVKTVKERFGREILIDKVKFLSAFGDIAPALSKEKRILSLALDEGIGHIFFDADIRNKDKSAKEKAVDNSLKKLKKDAWLSEQAANIIVACFTTALGWEDCASDTKIQTQQQTADKNIITDIHENVKHSSPEELYIKARRACLEKDYKAAALLYIAAAARGEILSQNEIGKCYEHGRGVSEDKIKAVEWYLKSALQGCAEAQFNMGRCYSNGIGVPVNQFRAFEWYMKSAKQGYAPAQIHAGYAYFNGKGIAEDKCQAYEWYVKAANQGYAYAQNEAGYCCYNGCGTAKDRKKAAEWYLMAAEQSNSAAQYNIGWCYQYGEGVEKNIRKAKYWYKKAARNGNRDAKAKLNRESV